MTARLRGFIRPEDVVIVLWSAVALPVLGLFAAPSATSAGGSLFGEGQPLRGVALILGVASALVALSTRAAAGPTAAPGALVASSGSASSAVPATATLPTGALLGPMFGGILFLSFMGFDALGLGEGPTMVVLLGFGIGVVLQASGRAPAVRQPLRRLLVLPFVMAGTILFGEIVGGMGLGPGFLGDVMALVTGSGGAGAPTGAPSYGLFVFGLVTAGAAVFYAMLVAAPRVLVEPEGGAAAWLVRFGAWYGGTLLGLGWVAALGR